MSLAWLWLNSCSMILLIFRFEGSNSVTDVDDICLQVLPCVSGNLALRCAPFLIRNHCGYIRSSQGWAEVLGTGYRASRKDN
jgi:hypothetical protein